MKDLLIIITIFFTPVLGNACNCKTIDNLKNAQEHYSNNSELIFIGKVIESDSNSETFKLSIIESIKGVKSDTILTGKYFDSCSFFTEESQDLLLVYANIHESGFLIIEECGLTRSFNFPFLLNKEVSVPPPPPQTDDTDKQLEHEFQIIEYKERALKVLNEEIIELRRKFAKK